MRILYFGVAGLQAYMLLGQQAARAIRIAARAEGREDERRDVVDLSQVENSVQAEVGFLGGILGGGGDGGGGGGGQSPG